MSLSLAAARLAASLAAAALTNVSTPAGGAPAQAVALARRLLAQLALPSGARAIKLSSVPGPAPAVEHRGGIR